MNYNCKICDYSTNIKTHLNKHLNTNKHQHNIEIYNHKLKTDSTSRISSSKFTHFPSKFTHFPSKFTHFPSNNSLEAENLNSKKKYRCECCGKCYTRKDNLKRHMTNGCSKNLTLQEENDKLYQIIEKQQNKLDNIVCNTHIGDTTINTINLNVFGKENLDMVTDDIKKEMIKGPFKMMPKLLELIYFNKKYPENHTMKLVNKNKELMKIHKKKGWELVDKVDTIDYLLEDKNYTLDSFYDTNTEIFSKMIKKTYNNFRNLFDSRDKELWKQIKRDVDLLLWNNM